MYKLGETPASFVFQSPSTSVCYYGANFNSILGEFAAFGLRLSPMYPLFIINPYFSNVLTLSRSKAPLRNSATQKGEKEKEWFTYSEATNFQWKNNPYVMIYTCPGIGRIAPWAANSFSTPPH